MKRKSLFTKLAGVLATLMILAAVAVPLVFYGPESAQSEAYNRPYLRTIKLYLNNEEVTATGAELNAAADVSSRIHTLTASGAVNTTARVIELDKDAGAIAATLASVPAGELMFFKDTSDSGTAAHTITLTGGTFNGTNTIATMDAPAEAIAIWFDSEGDGTIIENVGTVGFSGP